MTEELLPADALPACPPPMPPPLSPLTPPVIPQPEPNKNVKLLAYRGRWGEFVCYKSTLTKAKKGEDKVENVKKPGIGFGVKFLACLVLALAVFATALIWSAVNPQKAKCELCGAEVREWVSISMGDEFETLPSAVGAAIIGRSTTSRYSVCRSCAKRVKSLLPLTQSPFFEAAMGLKEAGGG